MIRFTSNTFAVEAAGPDGENRRTITGIAVPYKHVCHCQRRYNRAIYARQFARRRQSATAVHEP
jgi:hypothetical protein